MSLQDLEIEQEGVGKLALTDKIPRSFEKYLLSGALAFYMEGDGIKALFQVFVGNGFRIWYSRYWSTKKVVLKGRGNIPVLELRMSWRNQIKGTWEKILQAEVPEFYYQLGFVPHILTRAEFEANQEYQTLDAHLEVDYLNDIGMDYKLLGQFMNLVLDKEPAELYSAPKKCPGAMLDAAHAILNNRYTPRGKQRLLDNAVSNMLLAVLEDADPEGLIIPELTPAQYEAVYRARDIIEEYFPKYPGNRLLAQKVNLSLSYLMLCFKRVFTVNPLEFYNLKRIEASKELLKRGRTILEVAFDLEYETDGSFSKAFKKAEKMPPKEYQLRFRR